MTRVASTCHDAAMKVEAVAPARWTQPLELFAVMAGFVFVCAAQWTPWFHVSTTVGTDYALVPEVLQHGSVDITDATGGFTVPYYLGWFGVLGVCAVTVLGSPSVRAMTGALGLGLVGAPGTCGVRHRAHTGHGHDRCVESATRRPRDPVRRHVRGRDRAPAVRAGARARDQGEPRLPVGQRVSPIVFTAQWARGPAIGRDHARRRSTGAQRRHCGGWRSVAADDGTVDRAGRRGLGRADDAARSQPLPATGRVLHVSVTNSGLGLPK